VTDRLFHAAAAAQTNEPTSSVGCQPKQRYIYGPQRAEQRDVDVNTTSWYNLYTTVTGRQSSVRLCRHEYKLEKRK